MKFWICCGSKKEYFTTRKTRGQPGIGPTGPGKPRDQEPGEGSRTFFFWTLKRILWRRFFVDIMYCTTTPICDPISSYTSFSMLMPLSSVESPMATRLCHADGSRDNALNKLPMPWTWCTERVKNWYWLHCLNKSPQFWHKYIQLYSFIYVRKQQFQF